MRLKNIRKLISMIIFTIFILVFFNIIKNFKFIEIVNSTQVLPSLVKFIFEGFTYFTLVLFVIILFTFIFGRFYCSGICPLGTLQDIFIFISKKNQIKRRFEYRISKNIVRFVLFVIFLILFFNRSNILINVFEPFSMFGKIAVNIFKPVFSMLQDIFVFILDIFHIYLIPGSSIHSINISVLILSSILLISIGLISLLKGRWYCNNICPVGTILGFISKYSLFNVFIDENKCIKCLACEVVCKAECIDSQSKKIDRSRCISCFNCIDQCDKKAVTYTYNKRNKDESVISKSKRGFILFFITTVASLFFNKILLFSRTITKSRKIKKLFPVTPPGSVSVKHFTQNCISCHLCVSKCPNNVLLPSVFDYGLSGIMQPKMDYSHGFCAYDCNICSQVCPTDAIKPISIDKGKLIQIGTVTQIKMNCIVYSNGKECGACSEHCPTKAVYLIPYKGLHAPVVNTDICIGCGACEFICPAKPEKAIYVKSNAVHKKAIRPVRKSIKYRNKKKDSHFN